MAGEKKCQKSDERKIKTKNVCFYYYEIFALLKTNLTKKDYLKDISILLTEYTKEFLV